MSIEKTIEEILKSYSVESVKEVLQAIDETTSTDTGEDGLPVDSPLMAAYAIIEAITEIQSETIALYECPACGARASAEEMLKMPGEDHFLCCQEPIRGNKLVKVTLEAVETNREEDGFVPVTPTAGQTYKVRNISGVKKVFRGHKCTVTKVYDATVEAEMLEGKYKGSRINFLSDSLEEISKAG